MGREDAVKGGAVADVGLLEAVEVGAGGVGHVGGVRGIGHGVEVDDLMAALDGEADDGGADEAAASGDEELHSVTP